MAADDDTGATTIDAISFWQAIGQRAIGATIVTSIGSDGPAGLLGVVGDPCHRRSTDHAGLFPRRVFGVTD
jgi:hypothetical protein